MWELFLQRSVVTRASDPFLPFGHSLPCSITFSILTRKGMVRYAAPKKSQVVFFSVRYKVTRASGSDPALKIGGYPPTVALIRRCGFLALTRR